MAQGRVPSPTHKAKASILKFKLRLDHDKTKVYKNPLDICPGFFVGGPWFRKYEFSQIPAAAFFLAFSVKRFINIIIKVFKHI